MSQRGERRGDAERNKAWFGQSHRENKNLIHVKIFNRRVWSVSSLPAAAFSLLSSVVSRFRIAPRKREIPLQRPIFFAPYGPFSSKTMSLDPRSLLRVFLKHAIRTPSQNLVDRFISKTEFFPPNLVPNRRFCIIQYCISANLHLHCLNTRLKLLILPDFKNPYQCHIFQ